MSRKRVVTVFQPPAVRYQVLVEDSLGKLTPIKRDLSWNQAMHFRDACREVATVQGQQRRYKISIDQINSPQKMRRV